MKKRKLSHRIWLILAALVLSVSGCGGSSNSTMNVAMTETVAAVAMPAEGTMAEYTNGDFAADNAAAGIDSTQPLQEISADRKLIRTVHLNVETDAFDNLLTTLQQQIRDLSGYIEQSDVSGNSIYQGNRNSTRYASITARIPSDQLDHFLNLVEGSGNVTFHSESTSDVTLQYSDIESRKKSLTIEQERIWELLEKADSLEAVISLEERLSELRYELESMESQLRLYDNQVSYSTVYLNIDEVSIFTQVEPETIPQQIRREFLENLTSVGDAITDLIIHIITTSPVWGPLLILLGVLIQVCKHRLHKRRDSHTPLPTAESKNGSDNEKRP